MLATISRRTALKKYPGFPRCNPRTDKFFYPEKVGHYYLAMDLIPVNIYIRAFSKELVKMLGALQIPSLVFLGDYKRAWLYQKNDYKKVKEATEYFLNNGISESFDGGIKVEIDQLPEFLKHFIWLTRSNAALPAFHFMDDQQTIVGYICQHVVLHLSTLNPAINEKVISFIGNSAFNETDEKHYNIFPGRIKGRQTIT